MRLKSLKTKLLVAVSALVIGSGLLISLLVTQRYSSSLLETIVAQAENIAYEVALEAADKDLINDPVGLQKMLDRQMRSHRAVAYLLVSRNEQVLAHTFMKDIPAGLLNAKAVTSEEQFRFQKISATSGERYLDIAWPMFEGKGGVLRLGFLEKPIRKRVANLWIQMSALTLTVLLIALAGALIFVRRITGPLGELARATQQIDEGELGVRVKERGQDEVGKLAASFNHMVARMEEYTRKLEEQTVELERAHDQTRTFCGIVREIGTQSRLNDVCSYLLKRFQGIIACRQMVLLVLGLNGDHHFLLSEKEAKILKEDDCETALTALRGLAGMTFMSKGTFHSPLIPDDFQSAERLAIFPFQYGNQPLGALLVACPEECQCTTEGLEMVDLILDQTSGAINRAALQEQQMREFQARLESTAEYGGIVGKDPKMQVVFKLIEDIAPTDTSVLIQGESGTGKELVAHAIHRKSLRKDKPFVVINCSAYPATLLESELFGHEKGAFTGAIRQKSGRFEQADGGTVFLDEIGEISPTAQIKLLRVLQSHKFERVGGEQTVAVDVRILAATNKDLQEEVKRGRFREDLFYRLNVIPIQLPPLMERRNDIPLLSRHFLRHFATGQGKDIQGFSSEAMRAVLDYPWPGNVRELENSIEHATVLAKGSQIEVSDLPPVIRHSNVSAPPVPSGTLLENEKKILEDVLRECGWNKSRAAERLGISRSALYDKLNKHQITKPTPQ